MKSQIKIPDVLPTDIYRNRLRDLHESDVLRKIDVFCKEVDVYCDREGLFEDIEWLIDFEGVPSEHYQEIKARGEAIKSLRYVFKTKHITDSSSWFEYRMVDPVPRIMAFCECRCWVKPISSARVYWAFVKYYTLIKFKKRVTTTDFKKRRKILENNIKDYHQRQANLFSHTSDYGECFQKDIYIQTEKHFQNELRALKQTQPASNNPEIPKRSKPRVPEWRILKSISFTIGAIQHFRDEPQNDERDYYLAHYENNLTDLTQQRRRLKRLPLKGPK